MLEQLIANNGFLIAMGCVVFVFGLWIVCPKEGEEWFW